MIYNEKTYQIYWLFIIDLSYSIMCTELMLNKSYSHLFIKQAYYVSNNMSMQIGYLIVIYVVTEPFYCKWRYDHCWFTIVEYNYLSLVLSSYVRVSIEIPTWENIQYIKTLNGTISCSTINQISYAWIDVYWMYSILNETDETKRYFISKKIQSNWSY